MLKFGVIVEVVGTASAVSAVFNVLLRNTFLLVMASVVVDNFEVAMFIAVVDDVGVVVISNFVDDVSAVELSVTKLDAAIAVTFCAASAIIVIDLFLFLIFVTLVLSFTGALFSAAIDDDADCECTVAADAAVGNFKAALLVIVD